MVRSRGGQAVESISHQTGRPLSRSPPNGPSIRPTSAFVAETDLPDTWARSHRRDLDLISRDHKFAGAWSGQEHSQRSPFLCYVGQDEMLLGPLAWQGRLGQWAVTYPLRQMRIQQGRRFPHVSSGMPCECRTGNPRSLRIDDPHLQQRVPKFRFGSPRSQSNLCRIRLSHQSSCCRSQSGDEP